MPLAALSKVRFVFPFGAARYAPEVEVGTKAVMALYAQFTHANARMTNPDCILESHVLSTREQEQTPHVVVQYSSGETQTIDATGKAQADMVKAIGARSREMATAKFLKESELLKDGRGLRSEKGVFTDIDKKDTRGLTKP